jgi:hypothetical protein
MFKVRHIKCAHRHDPCVRVLSHDLDAHAIGVNGVHIANTLAHPFVVIEAMSRQQQQ